MIKTLGYSYWGFCEQHEDSAVVDTPDGGRFTRVLFVKELQRRGINVVAMQMQRESKPIMPSGLGYPKLDALFIEWRWPTWKNDPTHPNYVPERYEPDLDRQRMLLEHYLGQVPILIWDTDMMMSPEEVSAFNTLGVTLAEPALLPRPGFLSLPYFTDGKQRMPSRDSNRYVYVGSNYNRYEMFEKYYVEPSKFLHRQGIETHVWGNWLTPSPERPEQEEKVREYSTTIHFHPRNKFLDGMQEINNANCVTHVLPTKYCKHAVVTPRFFECLAYGTPGILPQEFKLPIYNLVAYDWWDIMGYVYTFKTAKAKQMIVDTQLKEILNNMPLCIVENHVNKVLALLDDRG